VDLTAPRLACGLTRIVTTYSQTEVRCVSGVLANTIESTGQDEDDAMTPVQTLTTGAW
jgi:hypothetical protein